MVGQGERIITVVVDGNNHNLKTHDGKRVVIQTKIINNIVTMEKCCQVVEKIRELGHEPKSLKFLLEIFEETLGNEYGDFGEKCLLDKVATYNVALNRLRIWENKMPIYENWDGVITKDAVALADTLLW